MILHFAHMHSTLLKHATKLIHVGNNTTVALQSVGANPPTALIGCLSPYTYLSSQEGLALFKSLIDASDLAGQVHPRVMNCKVKYQNPFNFNPTFKPVQTLKICNQSKPPIASPASE